jgi:hypothetical protein
MKKEEKGKSKKIIDIKAIKEKHEALDYSNGWAEKAQEFKREFWARLKSKEKKSIIKKK